MNRKIVDKENDASCASGLSTGVIAAIAEPPQIAVPVPINTHSLPGTRSNLPKQSALRNAALIVASVIDSESIPVFATSAIGRPKPSATIDHCKTCFDEKAIPGVKRASGEKNLKWDYKLEHSLRELENTLFDSETSASEYYATIDFDMFISLWKEDAV